MGKKTGRDRIEVEGSESKLADAMASQMAQQAWPGIFSGGKQIVATKSQPGMIMFVFNDGSAMRIVGNFGVEYATGGVPREADLGDVIDGVAWEEVDPEALEQ